VHAENVSAQLYRLNWFLRAGVVEAKLRELKRAVKADFDPNQPRVPAGSGSRRSSPDRYEFRVHNLYSARPSDRRALARCAGTELSDGYEHRKDRRFWEGTALVL